MTMTSQLWFGNTVSPTFDISSAVATQGPVSSNLGLIKTKAMGFWALQP